MQSVRSDIDQPLGQDRRGRLRDWRPGKGGALLIACAVAVFAGSTAIALRERPFRKASPVVVSEPRIVPAPEEQTARGARAQVPLRETGPSIVHLDPNAPPSAESIVLVRDPSTLGRDSRLAHLPDPQLIEETEFGPLPVRDAVTGRRPFDHYARPWSGVRGARIAIVIGGLGISQTGTQEAIAKLPPEITLAFAPLGNSLTRWMQTARREGHEVMLQVPLEGFDNMGADARHRLLANAAPAENLANLHWALSRITNYTGVVNYMGARFTTDRGAMEPLMDELRRRGLAYLDDGTSARSVAGEVAREKGVPFAAGDTVIDGGERAPGAILEKLDELERVARARGFAVGSGSALEVTVDTVAAWAAEVRKRGIELVPVSAVANDPERD